MEPITAIGLLLSVCLLVWTVLSARQRRLRAETTVRWDEELRKKPIKTSREVFGPPVDGDWRAVHLPVSSFCGHMFGSMPTYVMHPNHTGRLTGIS